MSLGVRPEMHGISRAFIMYNNRCNVACRAHSLTLIFKCDLNFEIASGW